MLIEFSIAGSMLRQSDRAIHKLFIEVCKLETGKLAAPATQKRTSCLAFRACLREIFPASGALPQHGVIPEDNIVSNPRIS